MQSSGSFRFEVVKPDGTVLSVEAEECVIPGASGSFGVLPGHHPFLTLLGAGEIWWRAGGHQHYLAVSGGFCEVRPDAVTVLAEVAEKAEDIDVARAARAKARAEEHLKSVSAAGSGDDIRRVREVLERAESRLKVAAKRGDPGASGGH